MADGRTAASIVVVDPVKAAQERDRLARELLSDRLPEQRHLYVKQDIALTAPFAVKVVCNSAQGDAESQEKLKATVDGILIECFAECDKSLNNFNPASEVSQINN